MNQKVSESSYQSMNFRSAEIWWVACVHRWHMKLTTFNSTILPTWKWPPSGLTPPCKAVGAAAVLSFKIPGWTCPARHWSIMRWRVVGAPPIARPFWPNAVLSERQLWMHLLLEQFAEETTFAKNNDATLYHAQHLVEVGWSGLKWLVDAAFGTLSGLK